MKMMLMGRTYSTPHLRGLVVSGVDGWWKLWLLLWSISRLLNFSSIHLHPSILAQETVIMGSGFHCCC